jgi:hypothetical protein
MFSHGRIIARGVLENPLFECMNLYVTYASHTHFNEKGTPYYCGLATPLFTVSGPSSYAWLPLGQRLRDGYLATSYGLLAIYTCWAI